MEEKECCPMFNPQPWDGKIVNFKNKLFIKDSVCQIFHIPLNFGGVFTRMWEKVEKAKASPKQFLSLSYDNSMWKSIILMAVSKKVPDAENVKISGKFMTKVFDGPFKDVPKFMVEMDKYVKSKGKKIKKMYLNYTTCPKCAKKYGHNYIVVYAQI